ncbi:MULTISPECIES: HTH domain-containing protein [Haloarcula]|uniref:HTH domain-containing protein n=1 Tax=Haloarcula TaxID=2237 RepID=UPI0023E820EA|nr:HTH domain-containing protein [Halomicroarcula sp. SHR3]
MHGEHQPVADRAELYVRSLLPEGYSQQQAATLDRVDGLIADGVVGERQVQVCGHQVPASVAATRTAAGERLVTRLTAFQAWAKRNDCSLAPAMELRSVDDSLADAHYRALRLPAVLLAEYRDGDLRCVTPHHDGEAVRSVGDRLDELATGEPTTFEPLRQTTRLTPTSAMEFEPEDGDSEERDTEEPALLT